MIKGINLVLSQKSLKHMVVAGRSSQEGGFSRILVPDSGFGGVEMVVEGARRA
jgi:hypothetical protein